MANRLFTHIHLFIYILTSYLLINSFAHAAFDLGTIKVITNTLATANHTAKLLEVASEQTKKVDSINRSTRKTVYRGRAIHRHVTDLANSKNYNAASNKELNRRIIKLKLSFKGLDRAIDYKGKTAVKGQELSESLNQKSDDAQVDIENAQFLESTATLGGKNGEFNHWTAINTSFMANIQAKQRDDNLKYQELMTSDIASRRAREVYEDEQARSFFGIKEFDGFEGVN